MSSQIRVTPLGDAESTGQFFCFLLEIDSTKILLDCGCTDSFNFHVYDQYREMLKEIDCILISHADLAYIGALPYVVSTCSLSCPIYTTVPVHNMGLMALYDTLQGLDEEGNIPSQFSLDDVDSCFDKIIRLRFMQSVILTGPGKGITIVPYAAGHSVGGCMWKLGKNTEEFVYAVDFNHKKERHLDGINFEMLNKPSILLTNSNSVFSIHKNKKQRDTDFVDSALSTLRSGGSVLVPVKGSTRVLELLLLLEQTWESHNYTYPIVFASHQSVRVVEFAKSMLEWMGETVIKEFGNTRINPFQFNHIKLVTSIDECKDTGSPVLYLASTDTLSCGFSKHLFIRLATNPSNLVIFVSERSHYDQIKRTGLVEMEIRQKVPLTEQELTIYKQQRAFQQEKKNAEAAFEEILRKKMKTDLIDEWGEEEEEEEETTRESQMQASVELEKERLKLLYWYDYQYDLFTKDWNSLKNEKSKIIPMFPFVERKSKFDEYGETIQPEHFSALSLDSQQEGEGTESKQKAARQQSNTDSAKNEEVPFKWLTNKFNLKVACRMAFIDFEGLSDGRSIKTIISRIAPRKLVIANGSSVTRQYMLQFCKVSDEITDNITIAQPLQATNISSSLDIFTVKIDETLLGSLQVKSFAGYELAFLTGLVSRSVEDGSTTTLVPLHDTESGGKSDRNHEPILVGNPKLFAVKKQLISLGMPVELVAGQLKCGPITIRKNPNQPYSYSLEGPLCKEYYAVKDALYSQVILV